MFALIFNFNTSNVTIQLVSATESAEPIFDFNTSNVTIQH